MVTRHEVQLRAAATVAEADAERAATLTAMEHLVRVDDALDEGLMDASPWGWMQSAKVDLAEALRKLREEHGDD